MDDPVDCAMVEAIQQVGHAIGIRTIAEYVEDPAILRRLGEMGVDYAQGYAIHRPEPLGRCDCLEAGDADADHKNPGR